MNKPFSRFRFYFRSSTSLIAVAVCLAILAPTKGGAHESPSVYDIVASVRERLAASIPLQELNQLKPEDIVPLLTPEEKKILGEAHIRFMVNVPVRVYVFVDNRFLEKAVIEPFWLAERGFAPTDFVAHRLLEKHTAYVCEFESGVVGLGVNSLSGDHRHYFVALEPINKGDTVEVTAVYPGYQTVGKLEPGADAYADPDMEPITKVPPELVGLTLLQVDPWRHRDARLTSIYTETKYVATETPDQIVLTWSDEPQSTQTIQWRTSAAVSSGVAAYMRQDENVPFDTAKATLVHADTRELYTPRVVNNPRINRHTVTLTGLAPGTKYVYGVGNTIESIVSPAGTFTTAPAEAQPFSFIYMGDPQTGFNRWADLVQRAAREHPDAAFCIIASDLVNRGSDRDDWDDFFFNAGDFFARRTLVPTLGNHEYHLSTGNVLYNDIFTLLTNGPDTVPPQHAYTFEYGNALFIILDSNKKPADQTAWLDKTLEASNALWKFVSFHHPIYSSSPRRDNPVHRAEWMPIFDAHHVDMVLQGHDHAYLRTWPMKNNARMDSPSEGTIYVVSVSGTKMYDMGDFDYAENAFADTATYQAIDIQIAGNRLLYRAYDSDGTCVDEVIIEK
ncbi:MAG TPA: metallophosphoesterase family protein [Candidatus Hydrogenedentes bacterium]|nr:metallophosphoesterase family protein [Candidatus Hydrogenedentota bacterium]